MILTPHALVGAAVVNLFPNHPVIGISLAFISHYLLDTIPHRDYDVYDLIPEDKSTVRSAIHDLKAGLNLLTIGFDFLIGIMLCVFIFTKGEGRLSLTLLGAGIGMLPDFLQYFYIKYKKQPFTFFQKIHDFFHNSDKMKDRPVLGIFYQLLSVAMFLTLFFVFK